MMSILQSQIQMLEILLFGQITLIIGIFVNIPGTGGSAVDSIFMAVCVQLAVGTVIF